MNKLKKIETYKNLILDVPGINQATYQKSVESSVTTSWGVNWDSDYIARDILQNFRDANLNEIEKVKVDTKGDRILVTGNNCFDLRKLFLNLEKSISDKIGLNVDIQNTKRNKGKISFEYKDLDQLNKIIDIIKSNY